MNVSFFYIIFVLLITVTDNRNGSSNRNGSNSSYDIPTHAHAGCVSPPVAPVSMSMKLTPSKITSLSSNHTYTTDSVVSYATAATITSSSVATDDNGGMNEKDGKKAKTKRKKRQKQAPPGLTAKGLERKFVKHNYVDRSFLRHPKLADNDDSIFERYSVFNSSADISLDSDSKSEIDNADATSSAKSSKKVRAAPFPLKIYMILSYVAKEGLHDIINWLPHGRAFQVLDTKGFQDIIMPKFFNMAKITSFYRQLNLYGFSRLTHHCKDKGAYYHEFFLRGKPYLTINIFRVKVKGTKIRAAGSPDEEPDFHSMEPVNPIVTADGGSVHNVSQPTPDYSYNSPTSNATNINNIFHSGNSNYSLQSSENSDETDESRKNNDKHQFIHNHQLRRRTGGRYASKRYDFPLPPVHNADISADFHKQRPLSENDLHSPLPISHPGILNSGNEFINELVNLELSPEQGCFDNQNNHNVEWSYMNQFQPPQQPFPMRRHSVANGRPSAYYPQSSYPKSQWNVAAACTSFSPIQMNNNYHRENHYPLASFAYPSFQHASNVNPQQMSIHHTTQYKTCNAGFGDVGDYTTARSQHEFQSFTDDGTETYVASDHIFDSMTEACLSNADGQEVNTYFDELNKMFNNWVDDPIDEEVKDERNEKGNDEDLNDVNIEDQNYVPHDDIVPMNDMSEFFE